MNVGLLVGPAFRTNKSVSRDDQWTHRERGLVTHAVAHAIPYSGA